MWQKKTKIKVIPINSIINILLSNLPKMDNLLVAYENQRESLWKIILTSFKNWSLSLWRGSSFKALSWKKIGVWIGGRPAPVLPVCGLQSQKQFSSCFSWYVIVSLIL